MKTAATGADSARMVMRIRSLIATAALDCSCRQRVGDALQRFVDQEQQRLDRHHLLEARQHRAAVAALLELLSDLEEISWSEGDRSVFQELANLFDDIAQQAQLGAEALRSIGAQ
jgi:hypothetical protein